ncbi:Phage holin family Hol44, holin superfamily V [Gracilibacillus ureilyticus]|uniref:Phage holin family Hol44, holin superfamily V n=1 Tax=Gracilibacillus ureilyticus TaxID=531814 RepID=A0A1H9P3L1_9BACI|nr:phage holin family protein [Gracilibacillus ureilyticus]SER42505.1 Phage holin family Hol44, holin superfamily V [Gracilibacillus ureilyticus]
MLQELQSVMLEDFYYIVPALWIVGYACKRTPYIPDWLIVWVMLGFGIVASCSIFGWNFRAAIDGVVAVGISVLSHQMVKQTWCKDESK